MKKTLLLVLTCLIAFAADMQAQLEYSAFTSTGSGYSVTSTFDYQSLGINPANLGMEGDGYKFHFSIGELGSSIYAEPLSKDQVRKDIFGGNAEEFPDYNVNPQMRFEAVEKFTSARLLGTASIGLLGFSYRDDKVGGFAFTIRSRVHWNSKLNNTAARFLFLGYHDTTYFEITQDEEGIYGEAINPETLSELFNPSLLEHIFYNEYILGYGRNILNRPGFSWYGGIALKYIQGYGIAYLDVNSETDSEGYVSLSPLYQIDYEDAETPSRLTGEGLKTAGSGFGFDLGMSFVIQQKLSIGIAVNDIGSVKWDANVFRGRNPDVKEIWSEGLSSYNIFSEAGDVIIEHSSVGEWVGLPEIDVSLPTNLRAGASYRINSHWELGTDFYTALKKDVPGSYKKAILGFGTRFDPAEWVQLSTGFVTGGQFKWVVPAGITFRPLSNRHTRWEIGIATRDIASLFKKDNATFSYCMGMLRFGIHQQAGNEIPGE